jgi:hypothetical protein
MNPDTNVKESYIFFRRLGGNIPHIMLIMNEMISLVWFMYIIL